MANSGSSTLLTMHYLEELCERVGFLHRGKLKKMRAIHEMVNSLIQREIVFTLKEPVPKINHKRIYRKTDRTLIFQTHSSETLGELIDALSIDFRKIKDLKIREGKLEDVFQRVLSENEEL